MVNEKLDFALSGNLGPHLFGLRFIRVMPEFATVFLLYNPIIMTARHVAFVVFQSRRLRPHRR